MSEENPYAAPRTDRRFTPGAPYLRGDRLKPRLKRLEIVTQFGALGMGLLSAAGVFVFLMGLIRASLIAAAFSPVFVMLGIAVPGLVARFIPYVFRKFYLQLGLMSPEEARHFPIRGPYPECWLEPVEDE